MVELLLVVVVLGILTSVAWPPVSRSVAHAKVNQAAQVVAHDLAVATSAAARQRRPLRLSMGGDHTSLVVADRQTGVAYHQRALGRDTEYGLDSISFSVTPVDLFPNGFTSSALTVTVTARGYSRRVTLSRAGWVRTP